MEMKRRNTPLAALIGASLLGFATLSQAAVLVSEDFSYGDAPLNGKEGGTGFSDAWSSSVNVAGGVVGGNAPSTRSLSTAFPSTGTLWVSFDWGHDSSTGSAYGGLTFYVGGDEKFLIGNTWDPSTWNMNGAPAPTGVSSIGMKTGVAKITLGAGATSTIELWVGATGFPVYVGGAPMATATGRALEGVNRIRIMGNNDQKFDNLLIGTTMADVDATDILPPTPTYAWTGAASTNFTDAANWAENAWAQWCDYTFGGTPTNASVTVDGYFGINSLTLQSGLTTNIEINSTTPQPVIMGVGVTGNPLALITIAADSKNLTINGDYISASAVTWDVGSGRTLTLNGPLNNWNGTASLVKKGEGTAVLTGANNYSGGTTISNGTLLVSGQPYFNVGRTTTVVSNAVFELYKSDNTFASLMPVSSVMGAGTFRLSGNSIIYQEHNGTVGTRLTFALGAGGLIDLQDTSLLRNGGWQELNWTDNKASMNIASGATFDIWDGQAVRIDALTGSGTLEKVHGGNSPSLLTVGVADGSGTFSGTIQNTGGAIALTKVGSGMQVLSGTNTYTGTTTVSNGTLRIDGNSSGATGALSVETGGRLGGHGSYGGNITLNSGSALNCELNVTDCTLTCDGQLSFTNLDFADCTFTVVPGGGCFTLIEAASLGTVTFANAEGKIAGVSSKLYISGNKLMLMVGLGTRISFF
jgi:autotransporter-associated beta strand protein